jgi:DNA-binding NtrC family response regulator
MRVLVIDSNLSTDRAVLRSLALGGYEIAVVGTAAEALDLTGRSTFDCVLVGLSRFSFGHTVSVADIRRFVNTSAVAFVAEVSTELLVQDALADGSIELLSVPDFLAISGHLPQPALLVGPRIQPHLSRAIVDDGLRVSCARTLQFAMNLLVDGWCQIVLVEADIRGLGERDKLAIIHRINSQTVAILASAMADTPPGISLNKKPQTPAQFIRLFERIVQNRSWICGLAESQRSHP